MKPFVTILYSALLGLFAALVVAPAAVAQIGRLPDTPTTVPGARPQARTLTIDEAVVLALRNSTALGIAAEAVTRERARAST